MYLKTYHPKSSLHPTLESIKKCLSSGWIAQEKINGRRCQIHIKDGKIFNYTRKGTLHTIALPEHLKNEILKHFSEGDVFEAEWVLSEAKLYLFDMIKKDNKVLFKLNYFERYLLLPEINNNKIKKLNIFTDPELSLKALRNEDNEGLVFRNPTQKGFSDSSIIRCRRTGVDFKPLKTKK